MTSGLFKGNINNQKRNKMKTIVKFILAAFILLGGYTTLNAQTGAEEGTRFGSGEDSIRCLKNLSLYVEFYKQKNYEDAVKPWTIVYQECPLATKNIYIHGENMLNDAIENTDDQEKKATLLDSLMRLYDKRIKHFNQKGYVYGKKGKDLIQYGENSIENFKKAYDILAQAIELRGNKTGVGVLVTYMNTTSTLFSNDEISGDEVANNYAKTLDIMEEKLEEKPSSSLYQRGKDAINKIFEGSGAATCENLIKLFKPRFEQNPENKDLLNRITKLLDDQGCSDSKLYAEASVKLNEIDPSAESAHHLAKLFYSKNNIEKAIDFYKQAIDLQENKEEKASYYIELVKIEFNKKQNLPKARNYARKAIELDPDNGRPYILIGSMYAQSMDRCGGDQFEKQAVLWAAVDKFMQAKKVDPDMTKEANGYINSYKPRFPSKEDIFFHNYQMGDTYTVGCWINETTTVRTSE
jgi:tetratricopeptide (TPR) repeat protein